MACDATGNVCCNYFGLNGTCVQECPDNSTYDQDYQCHCISGFASNGPDCVNIDECRANPCQNGTCMDLINDYSCVCASGYTGKNCSSNIDDCIPNPCHNGTCIDVIGGYACDCLLGFTDKNCTTNIDDCSPNPCVKGNCTDMVNDYICTCPPGYSGKNCSVDVDDCSPNRCQNGGVCVDRLNAFSCVCLNHWTGRECESCLIPNCTECLTDMRLNSTICVRCSEGLALTSSTTCGKMNLFFYVIKMCQCCYGYDLN